MPREAKLVTITEPGGKVKVMVTGHLPEGGDEAFKTGEKFLSQSESMRPGPHRSAREAFTDAYLRRVIK